MGILVNLIEYGRRCRAARILAGYENAADAVAAIEQATGVHIPARSLGALERGDQGPTVDQYFAIALTYVPPEGLGFWEPALDERIRDLIHQRIDGGG